MIPSAKTAKTIFMVAILLSGFVFSIGCQRQDVSPEKQDGNLLIDEAYIIGVDPCTVSYPAGAPQKGYVLRLIKSQNTVVTYNLPSETARMVDDTITQLEDGYLLPKRDRGSFKIRIKYRYAEGAEKFYPLCMALFDGSGFSKFVNNQV